jgi:hypothetical protein
MAHTFVIGEQQSRRTAVGRHDEERGGLFFVLQPSRRQKIGG